MSQHEIEFLQVTNVRIFAALLKEVPMGCRETVLQDLPLKNRSVKCLNLEENTRKLYKDKLCLFRALVLRFHGNERLEEETSMIFNLFLKKTGGTDPANFRGVCVEKNCSSGGYFSGTYFLVRY